MANTDVCPDVYTIELSPKHEKGVIALAAPWNALPRVPKVLDPTQPVYTQAVREFLNGHGLKDSKVMITGILRVDLEGDGEDEVLISATNYFAPGVEIPAGSRRQKTLTNPVPSASPAGSYSFVILRRVVDGKVRTQLIEGEFYPKAKTFNAPNELTRSSPSWISMATGRWKSWSVRSITKEVPRASTVACQTRSRNW